jgi:trehalose utilization protein
MKTATVFSLLLLGLLSATGLFAQRRFQVLVFAEGYGYGRAGFELAEMLNAQTVFPVRADFANTENILDPQNLDRYDILVLFNHNDITAVNEKNVTEFVSRGRGLVALHHVINGMNNNPELTRLIGGYYLMEDLEVQHKDFDIVKIPGVSHPVFEGVPDKFGIKNDQHFKARFYPGEPVNRLLACDAAGKGLEEDCGWTRTEGAGRVIYLSPGDAVQERPFIVNQPLQRLIINAVRWAGGE